MLRPAATVPEQHLQGGVSASTTTKFAHIMHGDGTAVPVKKKAVYLDGTKRGGLGVGEVRTKLLRVAEFHRRRFGPVAARVRAETVPRPGSEALHGRRDQAAHSLEAFAQQDRGLNFNLLGGQRRESIPLGGAHLKLFGYAGRIAGELLAERSRAQQAGQRRLEINFLHRAGRVSPPRHPARSCRETRRRVQE